MIDLVYCKTCMNLSKNLNVLLQMAHYLLSSRVLAHSVVICPLAAIGIHLLQSLWDITGNFRPVAFTPQPKIIRWRWVKSGDEC